MSARPLVTDRFRRLRSSCRGGFTLIEVLLGVVIVSVLAAIAIPNYRVVVIRARAADLLGRIDVVELAAQGFLADNNTWPPDDAPGAVPAGLNGYLPDGFSFTGEDFQLEWENGGGLKGVAVVTDNELLGNALLDVAGPGRWFVSGNRYVFVLETG
jgi:prepilin-type N-terminal cleavage/methylation domain-containing protein